VEESKGPNSKLVWQGELIQLCLASGCFRLAAKKADQDTAEAKTFMHAQSEKLLSTLQLFLESKMHGIFQFEATCNNSDSFRMSWATSAINLPKLARLLQD